MTGVLITREKCGHRDGYTPGKAPHVDNGRDEGASPQAK